MKIEIINVKVNSKEKNFAIRTVSIKKGKNSIIKLKEKYKCTEYCREGKSG